MFFQFGVQVTRLTFVFFLLLLVASGVGLLVVILGLTVERAHGLDGLANALDEPFALNIGETQLPHSLGSSDNCARQLAAVLAMISRLLLLGNGLELFFENLRFFVKLPHVVNLARK